MSASTDGITISAITATHVLPYSDEYMETDSVLANESAKVLMSRLVQTVSTLAQLKALVITNAINGQCVLSKVGGLFYWDSTSSATPDDITIVQPDAGSGRWLAAPGAFTTLSATGDVTLTGTTGTAGHGWITGPSVAGKDLRLAAGNATGGVSIRDSGANQIGYFTSTGLAVTGALSTTGTVSALGGTFQAAAGGNNIGIFSSGAAIGGNTNDVVIYGQQAGAILIYPNGTQVGSFTTTGLAVTGQVTDTYHKTTFTGAGEGITSQSGDDTSNAAFVAFRASGGTNIGSISRVTTTDAVAYNTSSDGRLKTNIRDFTADDSGRIIDGLKPRWFDWKASDLTETVEETFDTGKKDKDGKPITEKRKKQQKVKDAARIAKHAEDNKSIIGFIAQEEAAVDPALARTGAVSVGDDDPTTITKRWARSDAALVPILVAELKALRARVAALEAKK